MLKSELIEKLKDIKEDEDINDVIKGMDDFAKSSEFDFSKLKIDDFNNILENNESIKSYYRGNFDSSVGKAKKNFEKKFREEELPKLIEEGIKAKQQENLTPEQIQLAEVQKQLEDMQAEKERVELLNINRNKLKEKGLDDRLGEYVRNDKDIEFFESLITTSIQDGIKNKLVENPPIPKNNEGKTDVDDPEIQEFRKSMGLD
nr:hypothetical protein [Clostridium neonatale]DAW06027.1 MAG TPA: Major head protein [Caudoviricetes sp.]